MNIIIITDALTAPLYTPRVRFLNLQLLAEGHTVTWFTEKHQPIPTSLRPQNLIEIPYYSKYTRRIKQLLSLLTDHKNRHITKAILNQTKQKPDIVFVSTFHTFGLKAGLALAHKYNCPLHIDLRDIAEQTPTNAYSHRLLSHNPLYRAISIYRRNNVLRQATTLTTVSQFHKSILQKINPNTHIIYNGYDSTLFHPTPNPEPLTPNPKTIIYLGRWYGEAMQNPHPLFRAISGHHDIKVIFYTSPDVHPRLKQLSEIYDINIELHPYLPNEEVPELLRRADIALILTSPNNRGILTTKFFEALGTRTPILCTPSDNGELASLIHSTHSGIATSDPTEILSFIHTPSTTPDTNTSIFSRQHQTTLLINLLNNSVIKHSNQDMSLSTSNPL